MTHTAKHTPGPWVYSSDVNAILGNGDTRVVYLGGAMGGDDVQADIALIAAAPAMYEALRAIIKNWERGDLAAAVRQGAAALAQAEGKL